MESDIGKTESVSTAVIRAVSAVEGRKPESLEALTEAIDPDALDALFAPRPNDGPRTGGRLSFAYSNCRVTVDNGEFLTIEPVEPTERLSGQPDGTAQAAGSRSNRDTQQPTPGRTPESPICFVCQQPIEREQLQPERGELVHHDCRAELRCGISLETWSDR